MAYSPEWNCCGKSSTSFYALRVFLAGFLHMHTSLLTTFFFKKRRKNKKNVKKRKKRDLNKKRKKRLLHLCSSVSRAEPRPKINLFHF